MLNIKKVQINRINPAAYNPRKDLKPSDVEYKQLVKSIEEYGCVEPLVWNKQTGNLVSGHQRLKVLLAKGVKSVQVSVVDLSLDKEKALNIALNKISGGWDNLRLAELLDELVKLPDIDIAITGFELPEIEQLLAEAFDNEKEDDFDVTPELDKNQPIITKPGDLIKLGLNSEHRLFCGDVTKTIHLNLLMSDFRARLCHTDPPYGINYDRNNRPSAKRTRNTTKTHENIRNDNLCGKRYANWFTRVIDSISEALAAGAPFYIWNSHKNFGLMHDLLTKRNFKMASVITWVKESFCPGFGDYNEQVEFCLYGWKGGARHNWYGAKNESTFWQIKRDRTANYIHPTQKPLEMAEKAIRNSSRSGDIVFDPFLGSGTTLIAAARLGRRCFGMEIDPKYCDCIVRRYIDLAGKNAVSAEIAKRYSSEEVLS